MVRKQLARLAHGTAVAYKNRSINTGEVRGVKWESAGFGKESGGCSGRVGRRDIRSLEFEGWGEQEFWSGGNWKGWKVGGGGCEEMITGKKMTTREERFWWAENRSRRASGHLRMGVKVDGATSSGLQPKVVQASRHWRFLGNGF
jgi:hypothetical protein